MLIMYERNVNVWLIWTDNNPYACLPHAMETGSALLDLPSQIMQDFDVFFDIILNILQKAKSPVDWKRHDVHGTPK